MSKIHPWRCLCRFSVQITLTEPLRRIILQFLQIFLTDALTFILYLTIYVLVPTLCVGNEVTELRYDHACIDAPRRI